MKPAALTESELKKYKEWGLHLVPLSDGSKAPRYKKFWDKDKDGKWIPDCCWKKNPETKEFIRWSDEELLQAERVGINHEACSLIDVDCDDIDASQFMSEFPETFTVGSKVNGSTLIRKKLYFYNGFTEHKSFGKGNEFIKEKFNKKSGTIIENLAHTQSWCFGDGRVILNDVQPTILSDEQYKRLKESVREVYALTVLTKLYPKPDTNRDVFNMALTGTLLRETNWDDTKIEGFIKKLCVAAKDNLVKKRQEKVSRFRENLNDHDKKVWGVQKLTELCGADKKVGLDFIDAIKPEENKNTSKELVTLKLGEFLSKQYPKTEYLQFPITSKGQLVQVWANAGHGKTWFCLEWACSIANGQDFLKWKCSEGGDEDHDGSIPHPVLYVEGEMGVTKLQERLENVRKRYLKEKKEFNIDFFEIAPLKEQPDQTFESLTSKIGRANIENTAKRIFKETGKKPFIFLDNITALTVMQEKEGADWVELVHWLNKLRAQDYSVIFLHHGTKAGDSSSGSNLKERSIDISIHLSVPEDKEFLDLDDEKNTQIKIKFDKWREFNFTKHSKPFIAVLNRDTTTWSFDQLLTEKQRKVKQLHDSGLSAKEIVAKIKDVSQAQVYRILKMFKQEGKNEII